jgi:hypothetical protein
MPGLHLSVHKFKLLPGKPVYESTLGTALNCLYLSSESEVTNDRETLLGRIVTLSTSLTTNKLFDHPLHSLLKSSPAGRCARGAILIPLYTTIGILDAIFGKLFISQS